MVFHQTTWICEHVLLARYHLFKGNKHTGYNLVTTSSNVTPVNRPGWPAKHVNCLQNTSCRDEQYRLDVVTQNPRRLLGVHVIKKKKVNDVLTYYYGKVIGLCPNAQNVKSEYTYHVKMDDGSDELWTTSEIWKNLVD